MSPFRIDRLLASPEAIIARTRRLIAETMGDDSLPNATVATSEARGSLWPSPGDRQYRRPWSNPETDPALQRIMNPGSWRRCVVMTPSFDDYIFALSYYRDSQLSPLWDPDTGSPLSLGFKPSYGFTIFSRGGPIPRTPFMCVRYVPDTSTFWPGSQYCADSTAAPGTSVSDLLAAEALRLVSTRRRFEIIATQISIDKAVQAMDAEARSCIIPRSINGVEQWYHFHHAADPDMAHFHANDAIIAVRSATLKALKRISRWLHAEFVSMVTLQMAVRSQTRSDSVGCHLYI